MKRRKFFKALGIGVAGTVVAPAIVADAMATPSGTKGCAQKIEEEGRLYKDHREIVWMEVAPGKLVWYDKKEYEAQKEFYKTRTRN